MALKSVASFQNFSLKIALILSVFVGFVHLVKEECTYFGGGRMPKEAYGLSNCTWYRDSACCLRTEVSSVFEEMPPLLTTNSECYEYMNRLMCYFCSPYQYKWYRNRLSVCEDLCNIVFENCKSAKYNGTTLESIFRDGKAFCQAQDFQVISSGDNCFTYEKRSSRGGTLSLWNFLYVLSLLGLFIVL